MIKNPHALLLLLLTTVSSMFAQTADVIRLDVSGGGLVAHVVRPSSAGPHPAVILLGGSGGGIGWQDQMAELVAERGIVAMAVAYFGMPGLADELDQIPLEYIDQAITFVMAQPYVNPDRVGIGGVSKGGELALLVASLHPELRAVATFVPSGVVFQSVRSDFATTSSWSYRGQPWPFVPYGSAPEGAPIVEFYRNGLGQAAPSVVGAATIQVERINGPILLLSGQADTLWPSSELSDMIVARLREKSFAYPVEHTAYENAGHLISSIRDNVTRRGGTVEGNRAAQVDGQRRFLEFFETILQN